jgi:hypothetical protein
VVRAIEGRETRPLAEALFDLAHEREAVRHVALIEGQVA